jgi:hypothetical protein
VGFFQSGSPLAGLRQQLKGLSQEIEIRYKWFK